jgi:hypothetical protein
MVQIIDRIRRHHAVEHATIHILSARQPTAKLAGHSYPRGFRISGDGADADVRAAVEEALQRLPGEPALAVHPMCGTNIVVGGMIASALSLAVLASLNEESRVRRLIEAAPRLITASTLAFVASQVAGPAVQRRITTLPRVDGLRVADVRVRRRGQLVVHRVVLAEAN